MTVVAAYDIRGGVGKRRTWTSRSTRRSARCGASRTSSRRSRPTTTTRLPRLPAIDELAGVDGVLRTAIPSASDVERMAVHGRRLADSAPRRRAARAYAQLWEELRERIG
jgi:hypothetical protein